MRAVEFTATVADNFIPIPKSISELKNGQSVKIIAIIQTPEEDEAKYHIDAILAGIDDAKNKKGKKLRSII